MSFLDQSTQKMFKSVLKTGAPCRDAPSGGGGGDGGGGCGGCGQMLIRPCCSVGAGLELKMERLELRKFPCLYKQSPPGVLR